VYIKRGNQIPSGDYDARTSWRITSFDPDKTAEYTTGGVNNHYAYSNPEVDALMAKARSTIDEGARVATFRKLQEADPSRRAAPVDLPSDGDPGHEPTREGLPRPQHSRRAAMGPPDRRAVTTSLDLVATGRYPCGLLSAKRPADSPLPGPAGHVRDRWL
jgi:hypothetical protein